MVEKKVSAIEVKRSFLLANAGKRLFRLGISNLEEEYKHILDEIFGLTSIELDRHITDKIRLARYDLFDWYSSQRPFECIGPWPKMYSLDARLTTGNVRETAQAIEEVTKGKIVLLYDDKIEREKRIKALKSFLRKYGSIKDNLSFIYERFPIILFPGGEIRDKDYNTWARENNASLCRVFNHDLDDGNCRAVSYALEGVKEAPCFYGVHRMR